MKTTIATPPPRNIAQETGETLETQINLAPRQFEAYRDFSGQYDQVDLQRMASLLGVPDANNLIDVNRALTGFADEQTMASNRALREADLRDAQQLGGLANQVSRSTNPELYEALGRMTTAAGNQTSPSTFEQLAGQMLSGTPDYAGYVRSNPDLLRNWETNTSRNTGMSIEDYGRWHYDLAGRAEGRGLPSTSGGFSPFQSQAVNPSMVSANTVGAPAGPSMVSANMVSANTSTPGVYSSGPDFFALAAGNRALSGPGPIQSELERQAMSDLSQWGGLSDQETRSVLNPIAAKYAAAGLGRSNAFAANAALGLDAAQRARMNERRAFASGVDAQGFGQRQVGNQLALGASDALRGYAAQNLAAQQSNQGAAITGNQMGLQAGLANQEAALRAALANQGAGLEGGRLGLQAGLANQDAALRAALANQGAGMTAGFQNEANRLAAADFNRIGAAQRFSQLMGLAGAQDARNQVAFGQLGALTQARMSTYQDPFMAILGRQSSNIGTNAGLAGFGGSISGPNNSLRQNFDPFNAYASDLYNTNYNADLNARIASSNNRAGIIGGLLGAGGSVFGAAGQAGGFGNLFCWVAREVYGPDNPDWLDFREHMLTKMPADFVAFYAENGEAIAKEIADKPAIKHLIRGLMDAAKGSN